MDLGEAQKNRFSELRRRAEAAMSGPDEHARDECARDVEGMLHELQVHQVELEMQNEELRRMQQELEASREQYSALYDFAPVGYFTLDPHSLILQANLTGAAWLGVERTRLVRTLFTQYLQPGSVGLLRECLKAALQRRENQTCEAECHRRDGSTFFVQLDFAAVPDEHGDHTRCRAAMTDISARKTLEARRLGESNDRFKALSNASFEGIAITENGCIVDFNDQLAAMLGYSREELLGLNVEALLPAEERERVLANIRQGQEVVIEHSLLRKDRRLIYVEAHGKPTSHQGRPARVTAIRDITERKRSEEALCESEERFRTAFEQGVIAMCLTALDSRLLKVNPAFCQMLGYSEAELVSRSFREITHPDDLGANLAGLQRLASGETDTFRMEKRYLRKDGGIIWGDLCTASVRDAQGQPHYLVTHVQDITERKRAEAALRESEQEFRTLAETVPQIVWATRPDGWNIYFNQRWVDYTGLTLEEGYGHGWITPFHPDEKQDAWEAWQRATQHSEPYSLECRLRRADGVFRWWLIRGAPIRNAHGEILKWFGTCTDIEEIKRSEEALRTANEALAEADRRKDEFLAMLAHELRNPLAPIRNAVNILNYVGADAGAIVRQREIIDRQVTHMACLLDDLLEVSRITHGNIKLRRQRVRLWDVFTRAVETVNPLVSARRHTLLVTPPSDQLQIEGDFDRLIQILGNLLNNAAKYTEEGGTIWLDATCEGPDVIIKVRDTGVGIAPEMLPKVFDVFIQAERSLDRSQGGLGLGLTLVRNLVQLHGGRVGAYSKGLGQGSEFVVRLPLLPETSTDDQQDGGPPAPAAALMRRILVVDDMVDNANSLAELLGLQGHEVQVAYDGPSALRIAREFGPEVVLLDIGLPGANGYEVAQRLRQQKGLEQVLLIAVTGYGQSEDIQQSLAAGINLHLTKPVTLKALQEAL